MNPIEPVVQNLFSHAGALVYLAALVSFAVLRRVPVHIRARLRPVFWGALIFPVLTFVTHRVADPVDHQDLAALRFLLSGLTLARFAHVFAVNLAVERGGRYPINALFRDVIEFATYVAITVVALHMANLRAGSLIAGGTVVTAVLGLSLQDTIGNLAAGVAIQLERPVQGNDWVQVDKSDVLGRVVAMNWRAVTIQTDAHTQFIIPNSVFAKTAFMNYSRPAGSVRRSLYVTVPHDVSPTVVHDAMMAACTGSAFATTTPAPSVFTWEVTDRGITYWLRYWISDFDLRDRAQSDITTRVWYHFHRLKIPFAVPVRRTYTQKLGEKQRLAEHEEILRDRRAAIDAVDFLKPLADKNKQLLAERGHRRLFAPNETIIAQGDRHRTFYIVRTGEVSVQVDGRVVHQLHACDFFGEMGLLTGAPRTASVVATRETEVFEIDEPMFREVLRDDPTIAATVATIVGQRQAELEVLLSKPGEKITSDAGGWAESILARVKDAFGV